LLFNLANLVDYFFSPVLHVVGLQVVELDVFPLLIHFVPLVLKFPNLVEKLVFLLDLGKLSVLEGFDFEDFLLELVLFLFVAEFAAFGAELFNFIKSLVVWNVDFLRGSLLEDVTVLYDLFFEIIEKLFSGGLLFSERFLNQEIGFCKTCFKSLPSIINSSQVLFFLLRKFDSLVFSIFIALQELEFLLDWLNLRLKVSFICKCFFLQFHIALELLWSIACFL
jgi:hypothetical protein